jgi:hypothetical protein
MMWSQTILVVDHKLTLLCPNKICHNTQSNFCYHCLCDYRSKYSDLFQLIYQLHFIYSNILGGLPPPKHQEISFLRDSTEMVSFGTNDLKYGCFLEQMYVHNL